MSSAFQSRRRLLLTHDLGKPNKNNKLRIASRHLLVGFASLSLVLVGGLAFLGSHYLEISNNDRAETSRNLRADNAGIVRGGGGETSNRIADVVPGSRVERALNLGMLSPTANLVFEPNDPRRNAMTASLRDDLMQVKADVGELWIGLIEEGAKLVVAGENPGAVMEVGMHRAHQCLQAAKNGLEAYCVEPSPTSFAKIKSTVESEPMELQKHVHLYNVAAGGTSQGRVPFVASGGTGDHVGQQIDMWKMEESSGPSTTEDESSKAQMVQVPSKRLDDVVQDAGGKVFLLKVDTQGFEPTVFSGLTESLTQHRIKYVIFEYWPRGMDLLAGKKDACIAADLVQSIADMGYTLYALRMEAHPQAPKYWKAVIDDRPLDNVVDNCLWYFHMEELFPSEDYKMGYWSDVLAVAPGVSLDSETVAKVAMASRRRGHKRDKK